jgi:hypothetical protein
MCADALILRASETDGRELWFGVDDGAVPEAHHLVEAGYLERRWDGGRGDIVYRATDAAVRAQEIYCAVAAIAELN